MAAVTARRVRSTRRTCSSILLSGTSPCCTNRKLFDILRNEWQYDGILVTDCWALNDAYETDTVIPRHRTHATAAAAYADAFGREVDLECGSGLPALRKKLPGLDCGSCGSPTCQALAEDIVRGYARELDCLFLLKQKVTDMAKQMVEVSELTRE